MSGALTVPNVMAGLRLLGLGPLLWLARAGHREAFFWLMVALFVTDWADGKLATALDQETELGARLDSVADWAMYAAIGLGLLWLEAAVIRANAALIAAVGVTWAVSAGVSVLRFGKLPGYHNRAAKAAWLLAFAAALLLFLADDPRLLPWAFGLVILRNLDAVAIGVVLPEWRANVGSVVEAWRARGAE